MFGSHLIRGYAKTQQTLALSSAEAELYACVRASSEALGIRSLVEDFGFQLSIHVFADASAALGIVGRRGLGKLRHIDTQHLWVQQAATQRRIKYAKTAGSANPSDICTKAVEAWRLAQHLDVVSVRTGTGRARTAPTIN